MGCVLALPRPQLVGGEEQEDATSTANNHAKSGKCVEEGCDSPGKESEVSRKEETSVFQFQSRACFLFFLYFWQKQQQTHSRSSMFRH